jgi:F-type H+-transporting ATPase subunit a
MMHLSPDEIVFVSWRWINLNATIVYTWVIMALLAILSYFVTSRLKQLSHRTRGQNLLEIIVLTIEKQLTDAGLKSARTYLPFIGTLFLFIAFANLLTIVPVYEPPTSSLSTTAALALSIFFAVPYFGIRRKGFLGYLKTYLEPTFIMLPFNIISELTRTVALSVRLFGNMMSGIMILAILLSIAPIFFPIMMIALGLLTGMVQAYIFSILATVFIAAAVQIDNEKQENFKNNSSATTNQVTDSH